MSILKAALNRENVARDYLQAVQQDRKAEHSAVVAALHKAFLPEVPELEKLSLRGDYNAAVAVPDAQARGVYKNESAKRVAEFGSPYCYSHGIQLHLGPHLSREALVLAVTERKDDTPLTATIRIDHKHSSRVQVLATFHGHTEPSAMLERFFEVLSKQVVDVVID